MYTYSINVAELIDGRWQHLFRVEDLVNLTHAQEIAKGLRIGFSNANVTITRWSKPVGEEVK